MGKTKTCLLINISAKTSDTVNMNVFLPISQLDKDYTNKNTTSWIFISEKSALIKINDSYFEHQVHKSFNIGDNHYCILTNKTLIAHTLPLNASKTHQALLTNVYLAGKEIFSLLGGLMFIKIKGIFVATLLLLFAISANKNIAFIAVAPVKANKTTTKEAIYNFFSHMPLNLNNNKNMAFVFPTENDSRKALPEREKQSTKKQVPKVKKICKPPHLDPGVQDFLTEFEQNKLKNNLEVDCR